MICSLATVLLKLPVSVIERADLTGLEPARDAMEVEGMITDTPSHGTLLTGGRSLVGLALDAQIHDMVSADGTVVDDDIPSPESNCIPLLYFKSLLAICSTFCSGFGFASGFLHWCCGSRRSICHINVRHVDGGWCY